MPNSLAPASDASQKPPQSPAADVSCEPLSPRGRAAWWPSGASLRAVGPGGLATFGREPSCCGVERPGDPRARATVLLGRAAWRRSGASHGDVGRSGLATFGHEPPRRGGRATRRPPARAIEPRAKHLADLQARARQSLRTTLASPGRANAFGPSRHPATWPNRPQSAHRTASGPIRSAPPNSRRSPFPSSSPRVEERSEASRFSAGHESGVPACSSSAQAWLATDGLQPLDSCRAAHRRVAHGPNQVGALADSLPRTSATRSMLGRMVTADIRAPHPPLTGYRRVSRSLLASANASSSIPLSIVGSSSPNG